MITANAFALLLLDDDGKADFAPSPLRDTLMEWRRLKANQMSEVRELDLQNAGAIALANALLKDDGNGKGLMSPGPCADAQTEWRRLKKKK